MLMLLRLMMVMAARRDATASIVDEMCELDHRLSASTVFSWHSNIAEHLKAGRWIFGFIFCPLRFPVFGTMRKQCAKFATGVI